MGLSCSRLSSRSRPPRRTNGAKRTLSSLFACGASSSTSPFDEMEDDPAEKVVKSTECNNVVPNNFQRTAKAFVEITATSESHVVCDEGLFENTSGSVETLQTSEQGKCLCKNKELVPPHQSSYTSTNKASTSYEDRTSSCPISANGTVNNLVNETGEMMDKDMSHHTNVTQPSSRSPDGPAIKNDVTEMAAIHNPDSGSSSVAFHSPSTFYSVREDILMEATPSDGDVLDDAVSISSNILSCGSTDIPARESIQNNRFWDTFSRRSSGRHSDSRSLVLSTDNADELGSHDRWLLDFGSDSLEDGLRVDSTYLGRRTHGMNEWRQHSRSEIWGSLTGGFDGVDRRIIVCPSGLHTDGSCSCESILLAEDSGPHASISRIVMLAEALFEVLDEIHHQPVPLSVSTVSLPAPELVVDALPVKTYKNTHKEGDDAEHCYICLSEYEEGDKIRVLPCYHEYHMSCVGKWLKEMHRVCPVCRGDVYENRMEASVSNPELPST